MRIAFRLRQRVFRLHGGAGRLDRASTSRRKRDQQRDPRDTSTTKTAAATENHWSNGFKPSELIGLDVAGFLLGRLEAAPLRRGSRGRAPRLRRKWRLVACRRAIAASRRTPASSQLLASRGIGRPSREQAFGLMAARRAPRADRRGRRRPLSDPEHRRSDGDDRGRSDRQLYRRAGARRLSPEFDRFAGRVQGAGDLAASGSAASPASVTPTCRPTTSCNSRRLNISADYHRRLRPPRLSAAAGRPTGPAESAQHHPGIRALGDRPGPLALPSVDELVQIKMFGERR